MFANLCKMVKTHKFAMNILPLLQIYENIEL